jgi:hypothetical protein
MKQFDWKKPPPRPLQLWELQNAASVMLKDWGENHEKYNSRQEKELFKFFDFVLKKERKADKKQKENPTPKGLTPERIRDIQRNILGMDV